MSNASDPAWARVVSGGAASDIAAPPQQAASFPADNAANAAVAKSSRAKTLVFCTSFCSSQTIWDTRYRRWLASIRASGLIFDQLLIADDGSPSLPDWPDLQIITEGSALAPTQPVVLFHFPDNLGRRSVFDFPGWHRSFTFAATFAQSNNFEKIIHIESDAFLISARIIEYVNQAADGWIVFWCKRWNFAENAIQVMAGSGVDAFFDFAKRPYSEIIGQPPEKQLPFTHVERSFEGDRYGEYADRVPYFADFAAQTITVAPDSYYWWLGADSKNLSADERKEEEYYFRYWDGKHLAVQGSDPEQAIAALLRAAQLAPHRAEPLHAAAIVCLSAGRYEEGYQIAQRGIELPLPSEGLGIEPWIYEHGLLEAFSVIAYRAGHYEDSLRASERLLRDEKLSQPKREQISANARLASYKLQAESNQRSFHHSGIHYLEFLKTIALSLPATSYLEIGTDYGASLAQISCDAICIDPEFKINGNLARGRKRTLLFQMTSDDFFAQHNVFELFPAGLDLAFLDGLHHFEFLLRDFLHTERYCHSRSVVLLHDCLPVNLRMADRQRLVDPSEDPEIQDWWTGDVWRILPALKKYRPDLHISILDCPPTGLVIVKNLDPKSTVLQQNYDTIVNEMLDLDLGTYSLQKLWSLFPTIDTRKILAGGEMASRLDH